MKKAIRISREHGEIHFKVSRILSHLSVLIFLILWKECVDLKTKSNCWALWCTRRMRIQSTLHSWTYSSWCSLLWTYSYAHLFHCSFIQPNEVKEWNGVPTTLLAHISFLLLLLNIFIYSIFIQRFANRRNGTGSTIKLNLEFSACLQKWTYTLIYAWLSKYTSDKANQTQETTSYFYLLFHLLYFEYLYCIRLGDLSEWLLGESQSQLSILCIKTLQVWHIMQALSVLENLLTDFEFHITDILVIILKQRRHLHLLS